MNAKRSETSLNKQVHTSLDQAVEQLDMGMQSRLNQIRHEALAALPKRAAVQRRGWWQSMVLASVGVFGLVMWFTLTTGGSVAIPVQANIEPLELNEMDVLMSTEELDLLENLDIYAWLEAEYG